MPSSTTSILAATALLVAASACNLIKKDDADAAVEAAAPVAPAATTAAPAATDTATAAPLATGTTPSPAAAPGTPAVRPVDAGKPADAGAVADAGKPADVDGGKAAPVPTPAWTVPPIPGFDAGGFKPPPGFPSTIPTFPPPAK